MQSFEDCSQIIMCNRKNCSNKCKGRVNRIWKCTCGSSIIKKTRSEYNDKTIFVCYNKSCRKIYNFNRRQIYLFRCINCKLLCCPNKAWMSGVFCCSSECKKNIFKK